MVQIRDKIILAFIRYINCWDRNNIKKETAGELKPKSLFN